MQELEKISLCLNSSGNSNKVELLGQINNGCGVPAHVNEFCEEPKNFKTVLNKKISIAENDRIELFQAHLDDIARVEETWKTKVEELEAALKKKTSL